MFLQVAVEWIAFFSYCRGRDLAARRAINRGVSTTTRVCVPDPMLSTPVMSIDFERQFSAVDRFEFCRRGHGETEGGRRRMNNVETNAETFGGFREDMLRCSRPLPPPSGRPASNSQIPERHRCRPRSPHLLCDERDRIDPSARRSVWSRSATKPLLIATRP